MIRHAWHFYYALVLVIKVVCGSIVLCASHLNWALGIKYSSQLLNLRNGCGYVIIATLKVAGDCNVLYRKTGSLPNKPIHA
ncbi:DUF3265 domain-containing protein [Vibrio harveyi]|nr:DUF3265 domain-containing protein [Vibrio harveyi]ELC3160105.1 DUF3265 domain-containing protein [Vibrio harveyi]